MKIHQNNNIQFGRKFETGKILEITTQKIFYSNDFSGPRDVIKILHGKQAIGNRGYKFLAEEIGKKITDKYPKIKEATNLINEIIKNNPDISKQNLKEKTKPILAKLDKEIDISI